MWYEALFSELEYASDEDQAQKMSAYMKNKFIFLGIPKPKRKAITKPYLTAVRKEALLWNFVFLCWEKPYREAQYIGVEYLLMHKKELILDDLPKIKQLIAQKSWWDVTDQLDELVGILALQYPSIKAEMLLWSKCENLWIWRVSINFQQKYKEQTDEALLEQIIQNQLGSHGFFINKAIGWSLREYSKINPDWVAHFLHVYQEQLSPLTLREAARLLSHT